MRFDDIQIAREIDEIANEITPSQRVRFYCILKGIYTIVSLRESFDLESIDIEDSAIIERALPLKLIALRFQSPIFAHKFLEDLCEVAKEHRVYYGNEIDSSKYKNAMDFFNKRVNESTVY